MIAKHVFISGRVQGVFYRDTTRRTARRLGVVGWVRNCLDGRVEAFVQGSEEAVNDLLEWFHEGPSMARVDQVSAEDVEADPELSHFRVRY
jgi:acylphosphatase